MPPGSRQVFGRPPLRDQKVVWLPLTPWQNPVYDWQLRMDPSKLAGLYDRSGEQRCGAKRLLAWFPV